MFYWIGNKELRKEEAGRRKLYDHDTKSPPFYQGLSPQQYGGWIGEWHTFTYGGWIARSHPANPLALPISLALA